MSSFRHEEESIVYFLSVESIAATYRCLNRLRFPPIVPVRVLHTECSVVTLTLS